VAAAALSGLLLCSAHAGGKERGRSIDFSESRSDEVTTNLHLLTSKKDSLKQWEEDLYQPLHSFAPKSSLEGVVAPPARPPAGSVIQNKRVKELLERRKNWVFMTPEDLLAAPTVEEILQAPPDPATGPDKKELPPLERYYQRLAARQSGKNLNQSRNEDLFSPPKTSNPREQPDSRDDSNLPSALRDSALALKQIVEPDASEGPFAGGGTRDTFSDPFSLGGNTLSREQTLDHKKLMDEYHSLVDPSWQPSAAAIPAYPLPGVAEAARPAGNPVAGPGGLPGPAIFNPLEVQMEITHPQLGPAPLPDVNAQALGQPRSAPPSPTVESPKLVAPTFTAPRRAF
jgi:hypothetical protein